MRRSPIADINIILRVKTDLLRVDKSGIYNYLRIFKFIILSYRLGIINSTCYYLFKEDRRAKTFKGFWSGISILLGSRYVGGLLAMVHALFTIIFVHNWWTPKVGKEDELTYFILSVGELVLAFLVTYTLVPAIPVVIKDKS